MKIDYVLLYVWAFELSADEPGETLNKCGSNVLGEQLMGQGFPDLKILEPVKWCTFGYFYFNWLSANQKFGIGNNSIKQRYA